MLSATDKTVMKKFYWEACRCGNFWCNVHKKHVHNCDCDSIENWDFDPYSEEIMEQEKQEKQLTAVEVASVREELGLTRKAFAKQVLDYSDGAFYSLVEKGKRPVPKKWLEKHVFRAYTHV